MDQNQEYLKKMRQKGMDDDAIKKKLSAAGWLQEEINDLLSDEPAPPPPPHKTGSTKPATTDKQEQPVAVVQRYTTIGMEYAVMFVSLAIGAISLGALLHYWVNEAFNLEQGFALPTEFTGVAALVTLPIFLILFMRLKRKEREDAGVRADPSRRRGVQLALLVAFVWGIKSIVWYLYLLLSGAEGYTYSRSMLPQMDALEFHMAQLIHMLITLAIAGGIFVYYWVDEHKHEK